MLFIGYPVWWYHLPMIMQTFFETYDLSSKTIIPFNTHGGSRDSGTYRDIAALEPGAIVEEEPFVFFLLDYLAIMVLFAALGYGVGRLVKQLSKQKNSL